MIALFIRQDVTQLCTRFHFLSLLYGERYHTSFFIEPKKEEPHDKIEVHLAGCNNPIKPEVHHELYTE